METRDPLRHQLIESLMARHPEKGADAAIDLWVLMATQIISIVGEEGFNSLYARSVFLAQPTFPWLAASSLSPQADQRFANLKKCLEGQPPSHARDANSLLLLTFTGILAALIGEPLTTRILSSAWGDDASTSTSKEFKHE
ncbi:MAG TPA: hypothetical protein PLE48_07065 [Thiobacillus sp.]|nr:MAG: hypothetical protein B7Y50_10535 [Hydrogenophilales bacterium 28-61-11]OYZ59083.1 MAG: hypothetical protein B7Y21_00610 [Hydrogenophilales bacterium 16-61-112]OZA51096.1 MAG: hypothetical protein B7X81_00150 [Hydrogenophilales bacterium 17-61-76]HQT30858.1 hypothetical protein [Thiobacillus sp.]HQT70166.1 hypothetical protein [Thiobacillus sp.]